MDKTVQGPLDELTETLIVASGFLSNLRRRAQGLEATAADLQALDDAFSRSIVLTRMLRERVQPLHRRRPRLDDER